MGHIVRRELVVHGHVVVGGSSFLFYIDETKSFAFCYIVPRFRVLQPVERFAVVFIQRFLAALAIIDVDGALQILDRQVAEGLFAKVVERAVCCDGFAADGTQLFALQMVQRGWGVDAVEVPRGSRHVDT